MYANYHTHTFRCGHATGTEREYIERAIEGGIKIMGFSDHSPFAFPGGYESGYRVKTDAAPDYIDTLRRLREEYKGKIELHIGFEMEYYPLYFEDMLNYTKQLGAEYYILGQHFIGNEYPDGFYSGNENNDEKGFAEYGDCLIAAMETGVFKYVAHPDLYRFTGSDEIKEREWRRICKASCRTGVPLEINFLGIRDNRHYPSRDFWRIAGEEGCPVIYGCDAHEVNAAFDESSLEAAKIMTGKYNLKVIDKLDFD